MRIRIDPLSPEPIFEQVVFQVRSAVARGELSAGDRLPSVRELARELTINPNTVTRSYEVLESQGIVVRRQGSGCFVKGAPAALADDERRRRLGDLAERTVTEAFHLGVRPDELLAELQRRLAHLDGLQAARAEGAETVTPPIDGGRR